MTPSRTVLTSAPTRICDCGGWTDTWFAEHGAVCHIAIEPRVHVRLDAWPAPPSERLATIDAANFGGVHTFRPGDRPWGAHPLIEAAVESVGLPDECAIRLTVQSDMPPGASTGTSGAVCVAVVAAMRRLADRDDNPLEVARSAHLVETDRLGQQSGVQDQVAAACGGINLVEIPGYPRFVVAPLAVGEAWLDDLDARLLLVYLGRGHSSSEVHEAVIREVVGIGAAHPVMERLRQAAYAARDAVAAGDLCRLGEAMVANTDGQARLHPGLVGPDARRIIETARALGAIGWKVNGAGGDGGSITLLACDAANRASLAARVGNLSPAYRLLPIRVARTGLQVEKMTSA